MSPDGQTIVTGAGDETLRFWNVFSKARSHKVLSYTPFCINTTKFYMQKIYTTELCWVQLTRNDTTIAACGP